MLLGEVFQGLLEEITDSEAGEGISFCFRKLQIAEKNNGNISKRQKGTLVGQNWDKVNINEDKIIRSYNLLGKLAIHMSLLI